MAFYEHLFSPYRIRNLELRNRIVMPPMATNFADETGAINDRHIAYYLRRIRGGVGYVTCEHTGVLKQGRAFPNMALIDSDGQIPSFRKLVDAVHGEGGRIVIQINHAGRQTSSSITGSPTVAPSAIPCPVRKEMPRALSVEEIHGIVEAFGEAARRVREAGADGVEIHMAHGYLLCQFLSPFSNQRTDEYGRDEAGRMRMALEVLQAVRKRVGPDFPVLCRLSADEYVEGGLRLSDSQKIAKALEQHGADALHISACVGASGYLNHPPYYAEEGVFVHLAEGIKAVVGIPVITVGRIRTPELADRVVKEKKADLVSMGRTLIADPDLPRKALEGRREEILPCISCNRCVQSIRKGALQCAVNPETGREAVFQLKRAERPKKVWVIGGGPGGMKASEIASERGHEVTLFEEKGELGGRFLLAALPPKKEVLREWVEYMKRRLEKLPIKIHLGKRFDLSLLKERRADVIIVATGARSFYPTIEGIEEAKVIAVDEALEGRMAVGEKILIVGGGGIGAEAADYFSEKGKEVTVVEMLDGIALDLVGHLQHFLNVRLKGKGVRILTGAKATRFEKNGLWVETQEGMKKLEGFDSIIVAMGSVSKNDLAQALKGKVEELYVIGDASKPREVTEALFEAEQTALRI